jgi:hypothetical protein
MRGLNFAYLKVARARATGAESMLCPEPQMRYRQVLIPLPFLCISLFYSNFQPCCIQEVSDGEYEYQYQLKLTRRKIKKDELNKLRTSSSQATDTGTVTLLQ